ncbi:MAG: methyltransferase [Sulfurovum sp.]
MFIYQPMSGYCYNSDSIFLYNFISRYKIRGSLLDVGCGVGVISLLLSRDFDIDTTIIDKQKVMLDYATHNYKLNHLKAESHLGNFVEWNTDKRFDYIVSNPPFYDPSVQQSQNQHLNIARYSQHLPIESLIKKVKSLLKPRGYFIFCYDAKQIAVLLYHLRSFGITVERIEFVYSKIDRDSKLVMIASRNNSKAMTQIVPPFIVFDEDNNYTPRAKEALDRANTNSIKGDF